jgi:hypothetical protein
LTIVWTKQQVLAMEKAKQLLKKRNLRTNEEHMKQNQQLEQERDWKNDKDLM